MDAVEAVREIYGARAQRLYGLTAINQLRHALQTATLAQAEGAGRALVLAALLHDVGHMIHDLGDAPADEGVDDRHEALGADWIAARFGAETARPVRLHVAAKRWLVTMEPGYARLLGPDSIRSLALQGGLMADDERAGFEAEPGWADAVRLRRWDDRAKDPHAVTPDLDHFLRAV